MHPGLRQVSNGPLCSAFKGLLKLASVEKEAADPVGLSRGETCITVNSWKPQASKLPKATAFTLCAENRP